MNLDGDALAAAEALSEKAEALKDGIKMQDFKADDFKIDQKQLDEMKKQIEEFSKNFNGKLIMVDPKLADDLGKSFLIEDFKVDPKQMEELKKQMEQFQKDFKPQTAPY